MLGDKGMLEPDHPNASCKDQGSGCMDKCVEKEMAKPVGRYFVIGNNCHDYANQVVNKCKAQCGGK